MALKDLLGNDLNPGDVVALKMDHICGQIVKIEDGTIARGLSTSGQPKGELAPPHLIVKIEMTSLVVGMNGQCNVLKIQKPVDKDTDSGIIQ